MSAVLHEINSQNTFPPFILSNHELKYLNPEWDIHDGPFKLELPEPRIVLISGDDGRSRGNTDGSPNYRKFLAISKTPEKRIITTYLTYIYTGTVKVESWKPELKDLLNDIQMEHYDITPDRVPDRLLARHLERISHESNLITESLRSIAQQTFFDMLWNVDQQ